MVAVRLSALTGHPDRLTTGTPLTTSPTATAPVGLGRALGMPPNAEHVPTLMIPAAPRAAVVRMSSAARPPIVHDPRMPVGTEPSTITMWPPLATASSRAFSAASPAAAIKVS